MWKNAFMNRNSNRLLDWIVEPIAVYTLLMLLKLVYFSGQITGSMLGNAYYLTSLGSILILISIGLIMPSKAALWYLRCMDALLTLVIFSNIVFYRYFNDLISIPMMFQAGNVGDVQSSFLQLLRISDLLLAIELILLPLLKKAAVKKGLVMSFNGKNRYKAILCCAAGALIVASGFNRLVDSQPAILTTFYDRVYVAKSVGLLNYHAADAYTFIQQSMEEDGGMDSQKQQELYQYFEQKKQQKLPVAKLFGIGKDKNLIVIQVEALQQFTLQRSINGQEITPNLNKLIKDSLYFDNYYYQTAGGGTSDAEFTTNISMFPMKEGAVYIRKPGNYYYSLPLKLKEVGYSTLALHGYKPGFWNRTAVYENIGFDRFYNKNNMEQNELLGMGISDKDFLRQAAEKLENENQPFFSFLITLSSHFPYDNDKSQYSSFDVGEYKDTLIGDYLEAVHYTDEALGQFLQELEASGVLDNSVLAIYGDHHGIPKDNMAELAAFLGKEELSSIEWQRLQKVPMIISAENIEAETISTAGGGVDFMPTILNIMGIKADSQPSLGRDLVNAEEGLAVLRNGSFVTNDKIYISSENTCYDINTEAKLQEEQYRDSKQQADRLLEYSDIMIKYDLVDEIREYLERLNK